MFDINDSITKSESTQWWYVIFISPKEIRGIWLRADHGILVDVERLGRRHSSLKNLALRFNIYNEILYFSIAPEALSYTNS